VFTQIDLGRIFGMPLRLDPFFVLVLVLLNAHYWKGGDPQLMSLGFVICVGILASILLHELGHALVGRLFGAEVTQIELGGFGGATYFTRSLSASVVARTAIYLAGPAANLALWKGLEGLATSGVLPARPMLYSAVFTLAMINMYLLVFNLLPAYPLDGGNVLDAWLGKLLGHTWSVRIVGGLGILVAVACAVFALPSNIWMLIVALSIFMANWTALQSVGGFRGRR
jgi:Zn-dependent protease